MVHWSWLTGYSHRHIEGSSFRPDEYRSILGTKAQEYHEDIVQQEEVSQAYVALGDVHSFGRLRKLSESAIKMQRTHDLFEVQLPEPTIPSRPTRGRKRKEQPTSQPQAREIGPQLKEAMLWMQGLIAAERTTPSHSAALPSCATRPRPVRSLPCRCANAAPTSVPRRDVIEVDDDDDDDDEAARLQNQVEHEEEEEDWNNHNSQAPVLKRRRTGSRNVCFTVSSPVPGPSRPRRAGRISYAGMDAHT
jgi:hypothetical protein